MPPDPDRSPAAGRMPRRATDRVEDAAAWILTAAALLLIVIAGVTGVAAHGRNAERVEADSRSTSHARAVLLDDAQVVIGEFGASLPLPVRARWTDRDGREHTGTVLPQREGPAGAEIDVWIDGAGRITSPPARPVNAVAAGIAAAFGVVSVGGTLLVATWLGVRHLTGRANSRRWDQEWAVVEPRWRRNVL